jgi:hypothetical protein
MSRLTRIALSLCAVGMIAVTTIAPAAPAADEVDPVMGIYAGTFKPAEGPAKEATGYVVPMDYEKDGKKPYMVVVGINPLQRGENSMRIELDGTLAGGQLTVQAKPDSDVKWQGRLNDETLVVKAADGGTFTLEKTRLVSPTLGKQPPEGATVLLPFKKGEKTSLEKWTNKNWLILDDGAVQVNRGSNFTVDKFGDCTLHVEFMTPYEPDRRGQGRGNSGVYLQGRYEVQVLDSFGLVPQMNDCGSIYMVGITRVNACRPPLHWQTYDIQFHAPRFNDAGEVTELPWMTVYQNGIMIHEKQEIPGPTTAAPFKDAQPKDQLYLQDHGNPVRYRNIWLIPKVVEIDMEKE